MMEKLFLDTNIVLDLIGNREPFVKEAAFLFQLGRNKAVSYTHLTLPTNSRV